MQNRLLILGCSAILALSIICGAQAQGVTQAFTYQGFLRQSGIPVNNPSQQMRFRIYDAATMGTLLWDSGNLSVNVQNGLFSVQLNAPASVWTGAPRFLEIQINPAASGPTLTPRIPLNPTPYANTATLLNMFQSGTTNPDRMVITHSPPFQDWGLQYRDGDDSFHFLGGGISRLSINLASGVLRYPLGAAAGRVLTSDASGNASWTDLPASATVWAVSGNNIFNTNTGNMGVGTNTPAYLLDVRGDRNDRLMNIVNTNTGNLADGLYISVAAPNSWGLNSIANGADGIAVRGAASGANAWAGYFIGRGYFSDRVGIGTNSPGYILDVNGRARIRGATGTSSAGIWFSNGTNDRAFVGLVDDNTVGMWGQAGAGWHLTMRVDTGNVRIGSAVIESAKLNVTADSTTTNATLRLHETAADFARLEFTNTNTARKWHIAGLIGSAVADDRLNFWNSAVGDIMSIRGDGTVAVKVLEITGADLAEKFPVTDTVEPGMVVEIDPDNPGHLRKAQGAYNKRVVGVVAGANGLSKGIILGNLEGSENHTPIAMSGRVWVYADATERTIEPGDFLTTADKPGYAMKADDLAKAQGAIIGKAMTRLEQGKTGMVLVVVNLQ